MKKVSEKKKNNFKNKAIGLLDKANSIDVSGLKISKKNKHHSGTIDGEALPESQRDKLNVGLLIAGVLLGIAAVLVVTYGINFLKSLLEAIGEASKGSEGLMGMKFDIGFDTKYFKPIKESKIYLLASLVTVVLVPTFLYAKLNHSSDKNIAYGQKGDSRLATIKEIQAQYAEIPEKKKRFSGVGGVPISHYKDKYYIDQDTVNTVGIGASRSGKGETFVIPLIDNLSRAKVQSNMVLNDPKGELYSASKETLEKRGYRVLVLNIDEPLQSMSFNPLQLVINAWANHDYHEATKRANTLTSMLFASGMGSDNEFFYKSAKSAVNAIILTIVEDCFNNDCIEKITMYNVAQMLNELGSLFYADPKNSSKEKNALDEYFNNLPQGNQAKIQYGSTSFAGDKAKGSILSTASQGIEMFTSDLFGKLTSKTSIDLKEIGFPKSLQFKLDTKMVGKRVNITFLRKKDKKVIQIKKYRVKVKALGLCVLNFDEQLQEGDMLEVRYEEENTKSRAWYSIHFPKKESDSHDTKLDTKKFKSGKDFSDLEIKGLELKYTDQPTAVFMVIPDYDRSNHVIGSIFISQLYTELATNCKETPAKKCFRRVHFILDEFGNMPAINDMANIMTVCLGRNILFNLLIQSYSQLENVYDKGAKIIKENCQNHILIMTNDGETIEEISKKVGHKTVLSQSSSAKHLDTDSSVSTQSDQQRLITPERASQLIEGEQIILRNLHRQDKQRNKIRPFPIFNTKETNMPYRYQFLNDDFDTRKDINDIDIACEHINLSLKDNIIPFAPFIKDLRTRLSYSLINQTPITQEEFDEYLNLPNSQQTLDNKELSHLVKKEGAKESDSEDIEWNTLVQNCRTKLKELKEFLRTLPDDNAIKISVNRQINSNEFTEKLLNNQLERAYLNQTIEKIKEILNSLENTATVPNISGSLKNSVIRYKNSLDRLIKVA